MRPFSSFRVCCVYFSVINPMKSIDVVCCLQRCLSVTVIEWILKQVHNSPSENQYFIQVCLLTQRFVLLLIINECVTDRRLELFSWPLPSKAPPPHLTFYSTLFSHWPPYYQPSCLCLKKGISSIHKSLSWDTLITEELFHLLYYQLLIPINSYKHCWALIRGSCEKPLQ